MMTPQEAMAKASKLLKLSESSNPNEAALAAQRAQEILTRYKIDATMLSMDSGIETPEEPIGRGETLEEGRVQIAGWKLRLASKIAFANSCRAYQSGPAIGIIGRPSDIEKVRYLYAMLSIEIEALTKRDAKGKGRSYATEYRYGVVAAIADKLSQAKAKVAETMRQEAANEQGLVRLNKALERLQNKDDAVDAWVRQNMRFRSKTSYSRGNGEARAAGYAAGQSIQLGQKQKRLGC
jgi:hypothetical protein